MVDFKDMELKQIGFGLKFDYPDPIKHVELSKLYNQLRRIYPKRFNEFGFNQKGDTGFIFGKKDYRVIIFTPDSIDYRDSYLTKNSKLSKEIYDNILNFYLNEKEIPWEAFRVVGKYFEYILTLSEKESVDFFMDKINLFEDESKSAFYFKTTIVRDDKNIHFHFDGKSTENPEIDEEEEEEFEEEYDEGPEEEYEEGQPDVSDY